MIAIFSIFEDMKAYNYKLWGLSLLLTVFHFHCDAQNISVAMDTAFNHSFTKPHFVGKPKFLFIPDKKIIKYNPVSLSLGGAMYFYQRIISPQLPSNCPYEISCSNYSKAVINRYGLIKGIALTSYRLMRCNRIAVVDVHPLYFNSAGKIIDDPDQYTLK
jgi:putative component of membrane protein insertase Oxa1/YidC/SpoIIIJ protein YidD